MKKLKKLLRELNASHEAVKKELLTLPSGSLVFKARAYYHHFQGKVLDITHNPTLIRQLARKKLLLVWNKQIGTNLKHVKSGNFANLDIRSPFDLIARLSQTYRRLPLDHFFHSEVTKWANTSFKQNPYKPEERIYPSTSGRMFRSKSEAFLATILEKLNIPYHYEIALRLPGSQYPIYPDFIIRNPFTNKQIIWEHFGALNDPTYEKSMNNKMISYCSVPVKNRITKPFSPPFDNPLPAPLALTLVCLIFF